MTNIAKSLQDPWVSWPMGKVVLQGGFAGDSVVPPQFRLSKFEGRETCPTYNFGGDRKAAQEVLSTSKIKERRLVSKNVCHGLAWDRAWHERVKALPKRTAGMDLIVAGMELYLSQKPEGKLCHDPFAACCLLDEACAQWEEVEVYQNEKGSEWGSRKAPGTGTFITVAPNREKFFTTLTEV